MALAATGGVSTIEGLILKVKSLLNMIVPLLIAFAVVFFLFGLIKYVTSGDAEDKSAARSYMIWGVVAIFVMTAVWGLVALLSNTLGLQNGPIPGPQLP